MRQQAEAATATAEKAKADAAAAEIAVQNASKAREAAEQALQRASGNTKKTVGSAKGKAKVDSDSTSSKWEAALNGKSHDDEQQQLQQSARTPELPREAPQEIMSMVRGVSATMKRNIEKYERQDKRELDAARVRLETARADLALNEGKQAGLRTRIANAVKTEDFRTASALKNERCMRCIKSCGFDTASLGAKNACPG